jgi:hypothetical protein
LKPPVCARPPPSPPPETLGEGDGLTPADVEGLGLGDTDALALGDGDRLGLGDPDGLGLGDGDGLALGDGDGVGLGDTAQGVKLSLFVVVPVRPGTVDERTSTRSELKCCP